jgi:hypothetical protein
MLKKILLLLGISACTGLKYDLPSETSSPRPSDSTYIRVNYWDFNQEIKDLQVGPDGLIYVLFSDTLKRFFTSFVEEGLRIPVNANSFFVSYDRKIFILSDSIVKLYDYNGELKKQKTVSKLPAFSICAIDSQNFILSFYNISRLVKYNIDSIRAIDTIAYEGNGILNVKKPMGIFCSNNSVYVSSSASNWVDELTINPPYTNLLHLGGSDQQASDSISKFNNPLDVSIDEYKNVYVLELNNKRFQKFNSAGQFIMASSSPDSSLIPVSIAISLDGENLYVAYKNRIEMYKKPEKPNEGQ